MIEIKKKKLAKLINWDYKTREPQRIWVVIVHIFSIYFGLILENYWGDFYLFR